MIRGSTGNWLHDLTRAMAVGASLAILVSASHATAADMDANAKVLVKLDDDWSAAAATRDVGRVASFYADDALAYPPNAPLSIGKAAAQAVWASYFADSTFAISWKTTHAEISKGGDLGFTSGTYEDSYMGPDGSKVEETGKYLCVWKKQKDGAWKAIHDMWNSDTK